MKVSKNKIEKINIKVNNNKKRKSTSKRISRRKRQNNKGNKL